MQVGCFIDRGHSAQGSLRTEQLTSGTIWVPSIVLLDGFGVEGNY